MTSTSTDFKPTVEDFDQWTEKNDEEAFASIAQNYKVRHIIKGDVYWALVPGGRTYKLPLSMSIDDFTRLSNTSDDTESVEQLKRMLSAFAGTGHDRQAGLHGFQQHQTKRLRARRADEHIKRGQPILW